MTEGRIRKALSGFYYVDTGDGILTCRARGKFRREGRSPLVGDRVRARDLGDGTGRIEEILPRRNAFTRPAVANIDQFVVVASAALPRTDPYLIDRMLCVAVLKECRILLVLTKCDLDRADDLYQIYTASGIRALRTSASSGEGLDELASVLRGKLSALAGDSGVGKSSLLDALDPSLSIPVGEISAALGRGRHTTRHVEIFHLSCGADVVDPPGFSSFEAGDLDLRLGLKERLPETFPDFRPYLDQCRFTGCSHTREAGCAVLDALSRGEIQPSRHRSYLRLREDLSSLRDWDH